MQWKRDVRSLLLTTTMKKFEEKLNKFMNIDGKSGTQAWNPKFQNYFRNCLENDVRASCGASTAAQDIFDASSGVSICLDYVNVLSLHSFWHALISNYYFY